MKREFGVDPTDGSINILNKITFSQYMRPLCGTYATIESMHVCRDGLVEVKLKNLELLKIMFIRVRI